MTVKEEVYQRDIAQNPERGITPKMSLPRFVKGLLIAVMVFGIATYAITQSWWLTFVETLICALLIQAGYFGTGIFLVWRSKDKRLAGTRK